MKKALRVLLTVLLALVLMAGAYVAYAFLRFHRLGDRALAAEGTALTGQPKTGQAYTLVSYNVGFGAYEADFGYFMDGGDRSWAWSKERLDANLRRIGGVLGEREAEFYLVQEVDIDATRSYHVDERPYLTAALPDMTWVFVQNYDSPFLPYPFLQPHGASKAGMMTFSAFPIREAERVELPIEGGFMKFLDLDRCYSKCRIPLDEGGELTLYCLHLSAYTSDGSIATEQLRLLLADMEEEYARGSYCVAGGDFNKDLLGDSAAVFGRENTAVSWAQPIPEGTFDGLHISLASPAPSAPSCRNADGPYTPEQFVLTVDGFLVSENVAVLDAAVVDTGFAYSDHNPVELRFLLIPRPQAGPAE